MELTADLSCCTINEMRRVVHRLVASYSAGTYVLNFNIIGFAERRFYRKVVQQAERTIQPVLDAAEFPIPQEYAAEFDANTDQPTLTHRFNNKIDIHEIRFGTKHWEPGKSAANAVNQLASILAIQYSEQPLAEVFTNAGFVIGPARKCKDRLPCDDSEDAAVFITSDLSIDSFFRLAEEIDKLVAESGLGDVSGTGGGFGTWHIDLNAPSIAPCLDLVSEALRSRNIEFDVSDYSV